MRIPFGVLESFDGPAPQNDTPLAKMQAALENERAGFLALKQQLNEERESAFREGYGQARDEVQKMSAEEYATRASEAIDRLLVLERQNTTAVIELSQTYAATVFDLLAAVLPECAERAVEDDLLQTLATALAQRVDAPLVVRACEATAQKLQTRALRAGVQLPEIQIDAALPEGDIYAERGALRYQGSRNAFLTSAVQCLRRYLVPDEMHVASEATDGATGEP